MDKVEILNMARQTDIEVAHMANGKIRTDGEIREQWVVCFATMIEASVKEKAAKVCAELVVPWDENTPDGRLIALRNSGMVDCAAAIRGMK